MWPRTRDFLVLICWFSEELRALYHRSLYTFGCFIPNFEIA